MSVKKHQKHTKLVRRKSSEFGRLAWSFMGASCTHIQQMFDQIRHRLPHLHLAFVDADHQLSIDFGRVESQEKRIRTEHFYWNQYDSQFFFDRVDATLVNGNHYPAERQIVFIHPEKEASLQRRIPQLTHVDAVVSKSPQDIYPWLMDILQQQEQDVAILSPEDDKALLGFIEHQICVHRAPLKALVLAGGKSTRMGTDKSQLHIHGQTQENYLADLCVGLGLEVYISKRQSTASSYPVIEDRFDDLGPFGAICSAFRYDPNTAWLVIACDLPNLSAKLIGELIHQRNPSKYATAFRLQSKPFPEPLITIYEPRAYSRLLHFLSIGHSCPRKVLINSDVEILISHDDSAFINLNTPQDLAAYKKANFPTDA